MSDTLFRQEAARAQERAEHVARQDTPDKGSGSNTNVGQIERLLSVASGSVLVLYGLSRRSAGGLALAAAGGGLFYRGATGHCEVYSKLKISTADGSSKETSGIHVEKSITIGKSPEEVYQFWREPAEPAALYGSPQVGGGDRRKDFALGGEGACRTGSRLGCGDHRR